MNKKLKKYVGIFGIFMIFSSVLYASPDTCGNPWNCYKKGMEFAKNENYKQAVKELEYAAKALPDQAGVHSALAKSYEAIGEYQLASDHYNKQAAIYKKKGADINSYLGAKRKADELNSIIEVYEVKNTSMPTVVLQKYEPVAGAYIGAFISSEQKYNGKDSLFNDFNTIIGKKHATFFDYASVGNTLSNSFNGKEKNMIAAGAALHIAYEPNAGLEAVTESVIRAYAEELAALKVPVFLRYASEMNGNWVPWHGNPTKYIEKWRMVHNIMEEVAPNVAMVWSPSEMPLSGIEAYYPGDDYVDWVGISIYNAQFENGDINKPTDRRNSLEAVEYIYSRYAKNKPIMISEYAASHEAGYGVNKQDTSKFAKAKMTYFYESLRMKYPRVKGIQWYSNNNYNIDNSSKNRVNYSLLEGQLTGVLDRYKAIIQKDYFLSDIVNGPNVEKQVTLPMQAKKIQDKLKVTEDIILHTWIKSYEPYVSRVVYKVNGTKIQGDQVMPYEVKIFYKQLKTGKNTLEVIAFDSKGQVIKKENKILIK